jgi:hypothetical protein
MSSAAASSCSACSACQALLLARLHVAGALQVNCPVMGSMVASSGTVHDVADPQSVTRCSRRYRDDRLRCRRDAPGGAGPQRAAPRASLRRDSGPFARASAGWHGALLPSPTSTDHPGYTHNASVIVSSAGPSESVLEAVVGDDVVRFAEQLRGPLPNPPCDLRVSNHPSPESLQPSQGGSVMDVLGRRQRGRHGSGGR